MQSEYLEGMRYPPLRDTIVYKYAKFQANKLTFEYLFEAIMFW